MLNRLLFFIVMCFATQFAVGQKLRVESFTLYPGGIKAQEANVMDENNKVCAYIEVNCTAPEFTVAGNIQSMTREGNKWHVFMPKGGKWLEVTVPGFVPLRVNFADYGIDWVESSANYILNVELPDPEKAPLYKPTGFSIGGSYALGSLPGVGIHLAGSYRHFELEMDYRFGVGYSDNANWYKIGNDGTNTLESSAQYRLDALQLKLGYILNAHRRLAIVPQAGYALHLLHAKSDGESKAVGDGSKLACMTLGVKLVYSPLKHISLFAAPEYDIALGKSDIYGKIANGAGFTAGGFYCPVGVLFNF